MECSTEVVFDVGSLYATFKERKIVVNQGV
jgi:hypothetical protein